MSFPVENKELRKKGIFFEEDILSEKNKKIDKQKINIKRDINDEITQENTIIDSLKIDSIEFSDEEEEEGEVKFFEIKENIEKTKRISKKLTIKQKEKKPYQELVKIIGKNREIFKKEIKKYDRVEQRCFLEKFFEEEEAETIKNFFKKEYNGLFKLEKKKVGNLLFYIACKRKKDVRKHLDIVKDNSLAIFWNSEAIRIAIKNGNLEALKYLIEQGVFKNSPKIKIHLEKKLPFSDFFKEKLSISPIFYCIKEGQTECLDEILKEHKELEEDEGFIGNVLHFAIYFNRYNMLSHLLSKYFKTTKRLLNRQSSEIKLTPLGLACAISKKDDMRAVVELLWKRDVNLDGPMGKDRYTGYRAIHFAVEYGSLEIVKQLSYLGANISVLDKEGKSLLFYLKKNPNEDKMKNFLKNRLIEQKKTDEKICDPDSIENMVLKGGGVKGVVYIGALEKLEEMGVLWGIRRIAGTSMGAITGSLIALGYKSKEIGKLLKENPLESFADSPFITENLLTEFKNKNTSGVIKEALKKIIEKFLEYSFFKDIEDGLKKLKTGCKNWNIKETAVGLFKLLKGVKGLTKPVDLKKLKKLKKLLKDLFKVTGLCKGDKFKDWINDRIKEKTGIKNCTFGEFKELIESGGQFKHLKVFSVKAGTETDLVSFSSDDEKCKDLVMADAITTSMSFPGFFEVGTVRIKDSEGKTREFKNSDKFFDGGGICNLPIEAFDMKKYTRDNTHFNQKTLGLGLTYSNNEKDELPPENLNVFSFVKSIFFSFYNAENLIRKKLNPDSMKRVIEINTLGVGTFEILDKRKRRELIQSGRDAIRKSEIFSKVFKNEQSSLNISEPLIFKWKIVLDCLKNNYKESFEWLNICSSFGKAKIPEMWLERYLLIFRKIDPKDLEKRKNLILKNLKSFDLINHNKKDKSITLNNFARTMLLKEGKNYLKFAATIIAGYNAFMPAKETTAKFIRWVKVFRIHLETISKNENLDKKLRAEVYFSLGMIYRIIGEDQKSLDNHLKSLELKKSYCKEWDFETIKSLFFIKEVQLTLGDYENTYYENVYNTSMKKLSEINKGIFEIIPLLEDKKIFDRSKEVFKVIENKLKDLKYCPLIALELSSISQYFYKKKENKKAKDYALLSYLMFRYYIEKGYIESKDKRIVMELFGKIRAELLIISSDNYKYILEDLELMKNFYEKEPEFFLHCSTLINYALKKENNQKFDIKLKNYMKDLKHISLYTENFLIDNFFSNFFISEMMGRLIMNELDFKKLNIIETFLPIYKIYDRVNMLYKTFSIDKGNLKFFGLFIPLFKVSLYASFLFECEGKFPDVNKVDYYLNSELKKFQNFPSYRLEIMTKEFLEWKKTFFLKWKKEFFKLKNKKNCIIL